MGSLENPWHPGFRSYPDASRPGPRELCHQHADGHIEAVSVRLIIFVIFIRKITLELTKKGSSTSITPVQLVYLSWERMRL